MRVMVVFAAMAALCGSARAGGIFVPETGTQAMARGGAFVAKADDPTALALNPAGLAKMSGTQILLDFNLIGMSLSFARTGVYEPTGEDPVRPYEGQPYPEVSDESSPDIGIGGFQAIPLIAVVSDLGLKTPLRVAAGLFAPHGFPQREFEPGYAFEDPTTGPPPQRYDAMSQEAIILNPSIAAAYRIMPQLDVGARMSFGFGTLKAKSATWGVRNYDEYISKDGIFAVDVSDSFIPSFGVGALYRPIPSLELGAAWASGLTLEGRGTGTASLGIALGVGGERDFIMPVDDQFAACAPGGTVDALKACITIKLPQTAWTGARWILRDGKEELLDVELDFKWENWKQASDYSVIVDGQSGTTGLVLNPQTIRHGAKNTYSVRLGGSYTLPIGSNKLNLRAGIAHDTEAAPLSFTRIDFDSAPRTTFGLGAALELRKVRIELSGGASLDSDRTVPECNPEVGAIGCSGTNMETPVRDRTAPDPVQPLQGNLNQVQSPFNAGTYKSSYTLFAIGVTTWF